MCDSKKRMPSERKIITILFGGMHTKWPREGSVGRKT